VRLSLVTLPVALDRVMPRVVAARIWSPTCIKLYRTHMSSARAAPVFISGATGINSAGINGLFDPTQEKGLDGRVLYAKRGDKSVCMEHFGGMWQVEHVSNKGTDNCYAWVAGGCGAEACTSRQWMVWDGETYAEAPLVKMVAGAEAQRQVGCCCLYSQ